MEKNKYLIALDLDGTLLTDEKNITENTKNYLKQLENEGHVIVLCSGRAPRTMLRFYEFIGLKSPLISYNGALIHSPHDKNFKEVGYSLDKDFLIKLYQKTVGKEVLSILAENKTTVITDQEDDFLFAFFEKGKLEIIYDKFDKVCKEDQFIYVMKMRDSSPGTKEYMEKLVNELDPRYKIRFWWDCDYSEIHLTGVSKANSLEVLRDYLGFDKEHVLVFGDADNDIEMLSLYPNSFLMINGNPKVRQYANCQTEFDNNNDGVIKEIDKFLKSK